jgi:hypothetical protein
MLARVSTHYFPEEVRQIQHHPAQPPQQAMNEYHAIDAAHEQAGIATAPSEYAAQMYSLEIDVVAQIENIGQIGVCTQEAQAYIDGGVLEALNDSAMPIAHPPGMHGMNWGGFDVTYWSDNTGEGYRLYDGDENDLFWQGI